MRPFLFLTRSKNRKMSSGAEIEQLQVIGIADNAVITQVWRLADPLCRAEGVELVQVEYQREHGGMTLRLYLDKPGGITLDDCATISRQLGDILDVGLESLPPYRLEVSSPGSQRPLGKLSDFERFKGCRAKIRTARALENGRKNFTGTLEGISGPDIRLNLDTGPITIAMADIVKAHLINFNGETACLSQTSNAS